MPLSFVSLALRPLQPTCPRASKTLLGQSCIEAPRGLTMTRSWRHPSRLASTPGPRAWPSRTPCTHAPRWDAGRAWRRAHAWRPPAKRRTVQSEGHAGVELGGSLAPDCTRWQQWRRTQICADPDAEVDCISSPTGERDMPGQKISDQEAVKKEAASLHMAELTLLLKRSSQCQRQLVFPSGPMSTDSGQVSTATPTNLGRHLTHFKPGDLLTVPPTDSLRDRLVNKYPC